MIGGTAPQCAAAHLRSASPAEMVACRLSGCRALRHWVPLAGRSGALDPVENGNPRSYELRPQIFTCCCAENAAWTGANPPRPAAPLGPLAACTVPLHLCSSKTLAGAWASGTMKVCAAAWSSAVLAADLVERGSRVLSETPPHHRAARRRQAPCGAPPLTPPPSPALPAAQHCLPLHGVPEEAGN